MFLSKNLLKIMLKEILQHILDEQHLKKAIIPSFRYIPTDIILKNGNITLRGFRLHQLKDNNTLIGLTWQEEYAAPRESRAPELCTLPLNEIKRVICEELEIDYPEQGDRPNEKSKNKNLNKA